jgi:hypothetical protein
MQKNTYNGWYNYETWLFNLWHDDAFTEEAQECWKDAEADSTFTREENAAFALAERIESFSDEVTMADAPTTGFIADILSAAMQEVNFHEIAEHYIADVDKSDKVDWTSSSGKIELEIEREDAKSTSHQGQCDDDVRALSETPYVASQLARIDADELKHELSEYGAWDDSELADHDQNLQRLLWIACGDIAEGNV